MLVIWTITLIIISILLIGWYWQYAAVPENLLRNQPFIVPHCLLISYYSFVCIITILATNQLFQSGLDVGRFVPPGQLYIIGSRQVHVNCEGSGSPLVIFEHGYGGSAADWSWVQPQVAQVTKTCSYDRAGYGI